MKKQIKPWIILGMGLAVYINTSLANALTLSGTPEKRVQIGKTWEFTPAIKTSGENTPLTFSVKNKPEWMSFNSQTGTLAGTPDQKHEQRFTNIELTVSNGSQSTTLKPFDIKVVNKAPSILGKPSKRVAIGAHYHFVPRSSDINGDAVSFKIKNKPEWATFNPETGALYGSPTSADRGKHRVISIGAFDGKRTRWSRLFSINVVDTGQQIAAFEQ